MPVVVMAKTSSCPPPPTSGIALKARTLVPVRLVLHNSPGTNSAETIDSVKGLKTRIKAKAKDRTSTLRFFSNRVKIASTLPSYISNGNSVM